ncbi:ATP-dependent RecD-like DNA helicase [Roseimaritima multifibrata]|uniref:DNA helicase n=1 Tax=Roseimaritima multifibrata TaxID=1930274 RepID=A0A517MAW5_9BACT|nr:AAA domain-containing protein [Roseimaritima multifibrata]QDS92032.1 ATP-dependent RecD-like DNA helicase [Roseimaritima multifibrata]
MQSRSSKHASASVALEALGSPDAYYDELSRWLELEGVAERARMVLRRQNRSRADVEKRGETLVDLECVDHQTGLAGRWLLDFSKPNDAPLPSNRLKVGVPVVLSDDRDPKDQGIPGVVSRRQANVIQVATDAWPEGYRFRIDLSADETTRRRQVAAMNQARTARGRNRQLRDILLGSRPARFDEPENIPIWSDLNPPQEDAVRFAMAARDVAILHGPPGTGKTTTLAEIIYQAVQRGDTVLACAPSNTAVDNLLERLVGMLPNVLRVGHPARVFEALRGHTLDELVENDPTTGVIRDLRREVQELVRAGNKGYRGKQGRNRKGALFAEAGQLRGQIRSLEKSVIRSVLDTADVICTTTTIDDDLLGERWFDLVVVDEACQATVPSIWQAVLRAERLVLAGDHCQLPPTVLSDEAAAAGLRESLMQRLVEREGASIFRRLTVQYRMHEQIMQFSSEQFYENELIADASVKQHQLCDLPGIQETDLTIDPITYIDTSGAELREELEPEGESKRNPGEATLIVELVRRLIDAGVTGDQIAVIAPYAAQVRLLRNQIDIPDLEIGTVDGFQGREKEVVLITMVRSNEQGEIGFLADTRRTNVALTRARRKLIVVGESATLAHNPFYRQMLDFFEQANAYRSVWEFGTIS